MHLIFNINQMFMCTSMIDLMSAVPGVVRMRAVLDVQHGVAEAVLPEGRVGRDVIHFVHRT